MLNFPSSFSIFSTYLYNYFGSSSADNLLSRVVLRGINAYVLFNALYIASLFYLGQLIAGLFLKDLTFSFYLSFFYERKFNVSINLFFISS